MREHLKRSSRRDLEMFSLPKRSGEWQAVWSGPADVQNSALLKSLLLQDGPYDGNEPMIASCREVGFSSL